MTHPTCSVESCERVSDRRGLCGRHYQQWYRHGVHTPTPIVPYQRPPCSIEGCAVPAVKRGWCNRHWKKWWRNGDPLGGRWDLLPDWRDRFWQKVRKTESCWLWEAGGSAEDGRGVFRRNGRLEQAYRISYELLVGPIPEGLTLDHLCRTPACVNPEHLEAVTMGENIRRAVPFWERRKHGVHERDH